MPLYHVSFINDLIDSSGHPRRCCQRELDVQAEDFPSAIRQATFEFERLEQVGSWKLRAQRTECEPL